MLEKDFNKRITSEYLVIELERLKREKEKPAVIC